MTREFLVVGSGDSAPVDTSGRECLFVNSAVLRTVANNPLDLIVTTGLLYSDDELRASRSAEGLSADESYRMRKAKVEAFKKQNIRNLYIVTNERKAKLIEKLANLGVSFESLECISRRKISCEIVRIVLFHFQLKSNVLSLLCWSIVGAIFDIKIPSKFRPSTGGVALLVLAPKVKKCRGHILLDGIGNSAEAAYYPDSSGKLSTYKFNNIHSLPDGMIRKDLDSWIRR